MDDKKYFCQKKTGFYHLSAKTCQPWSVKIRHSLGKVELTRYYSELSDSNCCRFSLHKIEQELATEIKPIPKVIDKQLYVAEFQTQEETEAGQTEGGPASSSSSAAKRDWGSLHEGVCCLASCSEMCEHASRLNVNNEFCWKWNFMLRVLTTG